jgi:hypothetical protein
MESSKQARAFFSVEGLTNIKTIKSYFFSYSRKKLSRHAAVMLLLKTNIVIKKINYLGRC